MSSSSLTLHVSVRPGFELHNVVKICQSSAQVLPEQGKKQVAQQPEGIISGHLGNIGFCDYLP